MTTDAQRANARMTAIRTAATAKAAAEADAIKGLAAYRQRLDDAQTVYDAAQADALAAREHFRAVSTLTEDRRTWVRVAGTDVSDWDARFIAQRDAEAKLTAAQGRLNAAATAWRDARPTRPAADVEVDADSALSDHLAALPEALAAAIEHAEAIRQLSTLAGVSFAPIGGVAFDSLLTQAVEQAERQVSAGRNRRDADRAQASSEQAFINDAAVQIRRATYGA